MNSKKNNSHYDIDNNASNMGGKKEDFLSSILGNWKANTKNKQKNKQKTLEEDDALAKLSTLDEKTINLRKKTISRVVYVALFLSIGMFILTGLVKTYKIISNGESRKVVDTKVQDVKLEINSFTKWQENKDQEVLGLSTDIKNVETSLNQKIETIQGSLSKEINTTKETISENINLLQKNNAELLSNTLTEIKEEIKKASVETKSYANQKNIDIEKKIAEIEVKAQAAIDKKIIDKKIDFSKLALPPLPSSNTKKENKKEKVVVKREMVEVEELIGEPDKIEISTLEEDNVIEEVKEELPTFTLMPGFSKAILVTGADIPTLSKGEDVARALWLSTSGDTLIANGHSVNIEDCLIQANGTGNFASGVAEIRLSRMTCSAYNDKGEYFKISSAVKGWVYGEDGKYGLKGRLVSKEGEIIKKALPLTFLEGAINALENSTSEAATGSIQNAMGSATTSTASNTLDKFSDYYLKILESLNPTIELKAGREVTIAFAGEEPLKFEKYTPADINYFENKGLNYGE